MPFAKSKKIPVILKITGIKKNYTQNQFLKKLFCFSVVTHKLITVETKHFTEYLN